MKIMFIDTETGGIDSEKHSLLSLGVVIWEEKKILLEKEFFIKREEYVVTSKALEINKLNLSDFSIKGLTLNEIRDRIIKLILHHFGNEKVILAGHNVAFDIGFFKQIFPTDLYEKYFSYRSIDTASLLQYLYLNGKLTKNIKSLDESIEYFDLNIKNRHSALSDSVVTTKIFNKLLEL